MRRILVLLALLFYFGNAFSQERELIFTHSGRWDDWDVGSAIIVFDDVCYEISLRIVSEDDFSEFFSFYMFNGYEDFSRWVDLQDSVSFPLEDVDVGGIIDRNGDYWPLAIGGAANDTTPLFSNAMWSTTQIVYDLFSQVVTQDTATGIYSIHSVSMDWEGYTYSNHMYDLDGFMSKTYESSENEEFWWRDEENDRAIFSWGNRNTQIDTLCAPDTATIDIAINHTGYASCVYGAGISQIDDTTYQTWTYSPINDYEEGEIFHSEIEPYNLRTSQYYGQFSAWMGQQNNNQTIFWQNTDTIHTLESSNEITRMRVGATYDNWRWYFLFWSEYSEETDSTYLYRSKVDSIFVTDVKESEFSTKPASFVLNDPYPNPFNSTTRISYQLSQRSEVSISIFDILGREIYSCDPAIKQSGNNSFIWNAENFPSGEYLLKVNAGKEQQIKRITLIK